jgi:hypothetical protein
MNELVRGKKYRIEHKLGLFNPRLGTFVRSYTENSCHDFDRIITSTYKYKNTVRSAFCIKEWTFKESGDFLVAEQMGRWLSDYIPEDCAGIICEFLAGRRTSGSGPSRYPAR